MPCVSRIRLQDFNFEAAKKASGNVAGLCNWAAAMCTYHDVAKEVEPKIKTLRAAEEELAVAQREQAKAQDNLAQVHWGGVHLFLLLCAPCFSVPIIFGIVDEGVNSIIVVYCCCERHQI